jgi:hypothetical protein
MTEHVRRWWSEGSHQDRVNDALIAALFLVIVAGAIRLIA